MKDLNQIENEVLREMIKIDDQIKNIREINYEDNNLKRSTLQKMVHKFRFELNEEKSDVENYIRVNLPNAGAKIKEKVNEILAGLSASCSILIKAAKAKRKTLKPLSKPIYKSLKLQKKAIKEGYSKYKKYFRNRKWRLYLRQQTPEQRADRNISIVLGIVSLSIIELLLLIMAEYVDNQTPKLLAIGFGVLIGIMVVYMIILSLVPRMLKKLANKEIRLLEQVKEDIQVEGLTPIDIKRQGRKIKTDLINVKVALKRDSGSEG